MYPTPAIHGRYVGRSGVDLWFYPCREDLLGLFRESVCPYSNWDVPCISYVSYVDKIKVIIDQKLHSIQ